MKTSDLPPYAQLLGISICPPDDADTAPVLAMGFGPNTVGRPGFLHGGAIAGLLEMAAIAALFEALGERAPRPDFKPINMTINFMRGGREAETLATATIDRLGTRIANVEVTAWQKDRETPIAKAMVNFLIKS